MTETIDQARRILEERLADLEAEAERLRDAIARLSGTGSTTTKTVASRARKPRVATAGPVGPRAKRGERERQLLQSIDRHPGYRVAEHAEAVGVRPQQLYPLLHKLESSGKIEKGDDGYRAVDSSSVAVKDEAG